VDGGIAGGEGHVPPDVKQRVDGSVGQCNRFDGETETSAYGRGSERGDYSGQWANHEDWVCGAAKPACAA